jgi:LPXTG-motif cell wall-anchored protein
MKKTIAANDLSMTSSRPFLQQFQTVSLTIFGLIFVVIFGAIGYWYIRRKKKNKM